MSCTGRITDKTRKTMAFPVVKNIIIMTSDSSRDQLVNGTLDILRSVTCKNSLCEHAFENYNS